MTIRNAGRLVKQILDLSGVFSLMHYEETEEDDGKNPVIVEFEALPQNQGFARAVAGAYCAAFDPTVEELTEIKTAVSEAVSNSVIHGYEKKGRGKIRMELSMIDRDKLSVKITDWGKGIPDVKKAMEPLFSTEESGEMSGMGLPLWKALRIRSL